MSLSPALLSAPPPPPGGYEGRASMAGAPPPRGGSLFTPFLLRRVARHQPSSIVAMPGSSGRPRARQVASPPHPLQPIMARGGGDESAAAGLEATRWWNSLAVEVPVKMEGEVAAAEGEALWLAFPVVPAKMEPAAVAGAGGQDEGKGLQTGGGCEAKGWFWRFLVFGRVVQLVVSHGEMPLPKLGDGDQDIPA